MSVGNHHEIAFEKISPCGLFNEIHTVSLPIFCSLLVFSSKFADRAFFFTLMRKLVKLQCEFFREITKCCKFISRKWTKNLRTDSVKYLKHFDLKPKTQIWNCRGCFLKNWNKTPKEVSHHYGLNPWEPEVKKLWYSYYLPVFPSVCGGLLKKMLPFKVIFRNYKEKMG